MAHAAASREVFAANRAAGRIALSVAACGGVTRRREVYEDGPLRVRFPNVSGNALEAMNGPGKVRLTAELEDGAAIVHVEDTGPGIAQEIRAQLFQPFVSAGKRNGLGLGLALSRQTVLDHGGDMWVESPPGRGARFSFRLPGARLVHAPGAGSTAITVES